MNKLIITDKGIQHIESIHENDSARDNSVYEVFRITDGIALFLEDHFARLLSSVIIGDVKFDMNFTEFENHVHELCHINHQSVGNVKFVLSGDQNKSRWSFSFIAHSYPTEAAYREGVPAGLLYAERDNPNAKIIQHTVREKANQMMAKKKLYEMLLVDRNGLITEGSRSNVIFVKGDRFYTAPTAMILEGITRMKVLDCLHELQFALIEQAVAVTEIGQYDAVFLTGTSPKVLPVNRIDDHVFKTDNPMVEQLMEKYNSMIESYMASNKH